jgi:ABC-2 type transport system permease protein
MNLANRWSALLRREVQEYRRLMIYAPVIVGGVLVVAILISLLWNGAFSINSGAINVGKLVKLSEVSVEELEGINKLQAFHQGWTLGIYALFHVICAVVSYNFALGCLFDERRDRSTLFWRSLPVRDWETVLSKVAVICLVIPGIILAVLFATQLIIWLIMGVLAWRHGLDATSLVFAGANMPRIMAWQFLSQLLSGLWVLPVFAWCLLCSAYSKQRPILLAVFIPLLITLSVLLIRLGDIMKTLVGQEFSITKLLQVYFTRAGDMFIPFDAIMNAKRGLLSFSALTDRATSGSMWIGLAMAAALIGAAMWVRRYREDAAT